MNKVFKVIWSEARNAYVVVSEKLLAMLIATGVMTCASMAPAMAADPPAEALKHSTVAAGFNITVTPKDNSDGGKSYNVDLKNDIYLAGDDPNAFVNISGSRGTIWASGAVTAGSVVAGDVVMDSATGTVSGLSNKTTAYDDFANGKGKAATEEQLKEVATEAGKHTTVTDGANITVTEGLNEDGGKKYKVALNNDILLSGDNDAFVNISGSKGTIWTSGSVAAGNVVMDGATATVSGLGNTTTAYDGFANGKGKAATEEQLKEVATEAGKHSKVVSGNNINVEETDVDGQKFYKVNMNKDIMLGDLTGKNVSISGTNGTIETTGYIATKDRVYADKGAKLADIDVTGNKISNGASSIVLDGSNVKVNDKVTIDQNGKVTGVADGDVKENSKDAVNGSQLYKTNENVAALDKRVTDNETAIKNNADAISGLNTRVDKVEALAGKHTTLTNGTNISVQETDVDGQKNYKVNLNKDIILGDLTGKNVNISGTNGTIETTGYIATKDRVYADKGAKLADIDVTGNKISNGASSIVLDGSNVKVNDKVTIDQNGKVTGVADGDVKENSKDAVNGSQLYKTNQEVVNNTNRINQLGSRVNKVGAGAAALAALHPMDFDPDDKLTFSAGYGNYGGENAAAIGAYYRPDEKVMFSIGGTVGNGENMVNAGVSFSLDRTNHVSNSRTAMAREILDLRAEVTELKAMVAKGGLGSIAEDKMKIFPDVAENHWAYEYVGKLAAAGIIEGYPDGKFSGDRMMSRYEFAAMLYRAMQKGAQLDSKIINEFAPEMGRIRVDRISGEDGDRDKIERVRVNAVKGERDHYGNKLAK